MARKKYYLISKFETKEDFDKHFRSIYDSGYESGYKDGMTEAVSYIFDLLDHFSYSMQNNASYMAGERKKRIAMKNFEKGVIPTVPDDPAIRESRAEFNKRMNFKKLIDKIGKELTEEK